MVQYCYITEDYYNDNPNLVKILDINDSSKHNVRTHLCLTNPAENSPTSIGGEMNRLFS